MTCISQRHFTSECGRPRQRIAEKLFYDRMVLTAATSVSVEIHVRRLFEETEDAKDLLWIFSTASGFGTGPLQPKRCSMTVLDVQLARPTYMYMWVCSYIYIYIYIYIYLYKCIYIYNYSTR